MKTKILIFGITGDLSRRKLLPALRDIMREPDFDGSIIGVSRREVDVEALLKEALDSTDLADRTSVFTMNLATSEDYLKLKDYLDLQNDEQLLAYLAVPPSSATQIAELMGQAGINTANVKLLFEKPFGLDLASAQTMIDETGRYFKEDQIYRIDHYMAKDVASEIIKLRSDAQNHHHHWSNQSVESIEVLAFEEIGVGDRATFYEQTGALRDVIQGHLMQLLALVLMDFSGGVDDGNLPEYRLRALEQLNPAASAQAARAQYEGYDYEVSNVGSQTETFARLTLTSSDERWRAVNITLATGKKLAKKRTAIIIKYKDGSDDVFEEAQAKEAAKNSYEKVLLSAINSEKGIFTSNQEILRSWELLEGVQNAWSYDNSPLHIYRPGEDLIPDHYK